MGKRELLLILGFVVVGTVLYQATAPSAPKGDGFSLSEVIRDVRREMGDRKAVREVERETHAAVAPGTERVRVQDFRGRLRVSAVDGDTIRLAATITLRGLDDADLDRLEKALEIHLVQGGDAVDVDVRLGDEGTRPDQTLTLEVPRHLGLELEGRGVADVRDVAALTLDEFRGDVTVAGVRGETAGSHREGRIEIGEGARVELEARRSTVRLVRPAAATLDVETSDVEVTDAAGPVTIAGERSTLEVIGGSGPVSVTGSGGTLKLRDIGGPVDVDAERLTVSLAMRQPAPVTVEVERDDLDVTLPPGALSLDVRVDRGEMRLPDGLTPTRDGDVVTASSAFDGGGPRVALTVTRGTLIVRRHEPAMSPTR